MLACQAQVMVERRPFHAPGDQDANGFINTLRPNPVITGGCSDVIKPEVHAAFTPAGLPLAASRPSGFFRSFYRPQPVERRLDRPLGSRNSARGLESELGHR